MAASVLPDKPDPIFSDTSLSWASAYLTGGLAPRAIRPQGSFSVSPEGIADLDGSVMTAMSHLVRDPARGGCAVGTPPAHLGMRLVSDKML